EPVVRVAERVDVAHRAGELSLRDLEDLGVERRVEITFGPHLDLAVPALLNQGRQPADLELATDDDQYVGFLQLQDEARFRLDEVRILVAARQPLDVRAIAGHFARDRREVLGCGDDVQLALRVRGQRNECESDGEKSFESFHRAPRTGARRAPRWRTGTGTG